VAALDVKTTYLLRMDPDEFHLLGRALTGGMSDEDKLDAADLYQRLMEVRHKQAEAASEASARHLQKATDIVSATRDTRRSNANAQPERNGRQTR
jgi:hypothetical protein